MINLLYPAFCQACDKKTNRWDQFLCGDCLKKIKKRASPFCIKCSRRLASEVGSQDICNDCKKTVTYYDRALSGFSYDGILKGLVHDFKYMKMNSLAKEFAELTLEFMKEHSMGKNIDLVLSIPMHPDRLLKREVNLSHVLAKRVARKLCVRYSSGFLKKTKNTTPQSKLKRDERIKNIKGSFSLHKNRLSEIRHKNILLVDDLFTTGATVNECARILKDAGSGYVEVITLARGDRLE
ncbi:ComF family protein [Candidatus Omnitrophota bacterium]